MIRRLLLAASLSVPLALSATASLAQQAATTATQDELTAILDAIAVIGCTTGTAPVEREIDGLFEIDDALCNAGQFDIKLDQNFVIISITNDMADDNAGAPPEGVTAEDEELIQAALDPFNCEIGTTPVEREADGLYEIDDAVCEGGQYDIKLDGQFNVVNLTFDGREGGIGGPLPPPAAPPPAQARRSRLPSSHRPSSRRRSSRLRRASSRSR